MIACAHLMNLLDEQFVPLLGQVRNDGMAPLVIIGVGEDVTIREPAETVAAAVGYQGTIKFDASKPDGTPRKLMDVSRLHVMGWQAPTEFRKGLEVAYRDFLENGREVGRREAQE